jgi:threonine/homoserine/homoserine lactone efflux protein
VSLFVVCLIAAVLGYLAAMPILGPIAVMVISRGIEGRFDEARKLGMGAALAEGTYAGIAFGFATLFARYPAALPVSRVLTSIVLAVVGVSFIRYTPKPIAAVEEPKARSAFGLGFLTSGLNPTIIATWTAVAAGIHSRQLVEMRVWMAVPFGLSACIGIGSWYVTLVALMTKYHSRLPARGMRIFIRVMGGVLLGIAAWTLISLIR